MLSLDFVFVCFVFLTIMVFVHFAYMKLMIIASFTTMFQFERADSLIKPFAVPTNSY